LNILSHLILIEGSLTPSFALKIISNQGLPLALVLLKHGLFKKIKKALDKS